MRPCPCGRQFEQHYEDQRRCPRCRALQLMLDGRTHSEVLALWKAMQITDAWELANRHLHDYIVIDPVSRREVWAKDLAKQYRAETQPRPMGRQRYQ